MNTRKITGFVFKDDIHEHVLADKIKQGDRLEVWLINPGPHYVEVNLEFQQPDVIFQFTESAIDRLVKYLGYDPTVGIGKRAKAEMFGKLEDPIDDNVSQ